MKDRVSIPLFLIIVNLCLFMNLGCEKENKNPTIKFLQPESNIIINNDTLISIIVEPFDEDGTINRVEFLLNDSIINTLFKPPYTYDWTIETARHFGSNKIKAIAYDNNGAIAEKEITIEVKSFLSKWIGMYRGISHHLSASITQVNGKLQYVTTDITRNVSVNVKFGMQASSLNFEIKYDDSILDKKENVLFSNKGDHFSSWGGGSSYGSLSIKFTVDSLYYDAFQKCGIPCSDGISFDIKRN